MYDLNVQTFSRNEQHKIKFFKYTKNRWIAHGGVFKQGRLVAENITSGMYQVVYDPSLKVVPTEYMLHPNYPNPFNPITTIPFDLPKKSHVTLNIYSVLGQKVRTLLQETLPAGFHDVRWDGKGLRGTELSSGIYFIQLRSDFGVRNQKVVFIK